MGFVFVGERLAVDLLNTVVADGARPRDLLVDQPSVAAWAAAAGLGSTQRLTARRAKAPEPATIRRFREVLRRGLIGWAARGRAPAGLIAVLNRQLARDPQRPVLVPRGGGASLGVQPTAAGFDRVYAALAGSAADLLAHGEPRRFRKCANTGCLLMFYDVSRGGRRRWCSMRSCGTRAKVRAHYWRRRRSHSAGRRV